MRDIPSVKFGYPPKSIPASTRGDALVSTIPITKGEQIIVASKTPASHQTAPSNTTAQVQPPPAQNAPRAPTRTRLPTMAPPAASKPTQIGQETVLELPRGAGVIQHRIVPDDNSCLFSSLGIVFKGGYSESICNELRQGESDSIRQCQ